MSDIVEKLSTVLNRARISVDTAVLDDLAWDALSEGRLHPRHSPQPCAPIAAVTPVSTEEVRRVVEFANAENLALVPFGGGSGLMGGALSIRPSLVVDLRCMNQIMEIDTEAHSLRVQAGAVLEAVDQKLNDVGFILGHDPWTVPVATIGGAISTNSVGYRAGIYGSMGEQVLGLEAVLPNGEILRTRAVSKHSAGLKLNALLIGGEGCFGIITEATVKIFPKPQRRHFLGYLFASFEHGYAAIQAMFEQRLRPALLDYGDDQERHDPGALLYLVFEGNAEIASLEEKIAVAICTAHGGESLPRADVEEFWNCRHEIARRFMRNRRQRRERGRDGMYRDWIHVALPASKVLSFRSAAQAVIQRRGVRLQESGLWVQPELFSMRLGADEDDVRDAQLILEETIEELLRLVQQVGGSMEYTHGVGVKLAPLMAEEHGYGLEVMRRIKQEFDPNNIMNPGKMGLS
ncbi:MAG TPA: FAD-binding oxidoreductase [Terriglobales bacterium]|jgi:alkyldihydroxyacetonephosphate synthase|nr:FAD-binding oxidoreductase [Terriglobales bacterium]